MNDLMRIVFLPSGKPQRSFNSGEHKACQPASKAFYFACNMHATNRLKQTLEQLMTEFQDCIPGFGLAVWVCDSAVADSLKKPAVAESANVTAWRRGWLAICPSSHTISWVRGPGPAGLSCVGLFLQDRNEHFYLLNSTPGLWIKHQYKTWPREMLSWDHKIIPNSGASTGH